MLGSVRLRSFGRPQPLAVGARLDRERLPSLSRLAGQLAPVLGALLLLCTGLWAVSEYARHKAEVRTAETTRHLEAFAREPVASARRRLAATADRGARSGSDGAWPAPAAGGPYLELAEQDAAELDERVADVEIVLASYRRLALCIRMGNCDPAAARQRLGDRPARFYERHRDYLTAAHPAADVARVFEALAAPVEPVLHGP